MKPVVCVILLGFAIRLYTFFFIPLINPDGILYIQQAKALYYGLWDSLTLCYHHFSNYPVFIAASYKIFGDWLLGARIVSLFFGTISLIPFYLLTRRFFDETVSALTLLVFALLPVFIYVSRDVMRDPAYWFFALLGLYLFILQIEKPGKWLLFLSSISFIMGMWARIETVLFILISFGYLVITKKWRSVFFFLTPPLFISLVAGICIWVFHRDMPTVFEPRILTVPLDIVSGYQALRDNLSLMADQRPEGFSPYFFPKVRNLVWLIALGVLGVQIVEALFYPFFLIFILGVPGSMHRIRKDPRLVYLSVTAVMALVVLYGQILFNWAMFSRFIALFLFPGFFFMGLGVEKIIRFLTPRLKKGRSAACAVLCLIILLPGLAKSLRANYVEDKLVFKEIGEFIARKEGSTRAVSVAGGFKRVKIVFFYANLNYDGAPCFDPEAELTRGHPPDTRWIKKKGFHYFLWDEKSGTPEGLDQILKDRAYVKLNEWHSSRLGRLILFSVMRDA
ncbi:glycosyltransferase family 39 protein [Desulfococcaceae bacterium HSG8]|nr:glycosyltransferase family 39 protein [Desulfococcaceae bacterium HSG8]